MKKLIIANWKMNPDSTGRALRLAKQIDKAVPDFVEVVIAPPFIFLDIVGKAIKNSKLGAQDDFWEAKGAYTGEISADQLKHLRVGYVLIGHSERRALGETDEMINKKIKTSLKEGLRVVLCVGEPLNIRERGLLEAKKFVRDQIQKGLKGNERLGLKDLIIAYEPIWAIGSGKSDKPEEVLEIVMFIKEILASRFKSYDNNILYGGSVNSRNAKDFLRHPLINGALVGGASLNAKEFGKILEVASS